MKSIKRMNVIDSKELSMLFFRKVVSTFRQHALAAWEWLYGRAYVLLALTTLMWGGNAVASRLAVGHIS
ncbi:MAG TPA: hypothetical protein VEY05_02315, partial [Beijerinckiaceae bacterium]|nr:hypothetical protein [Beijerinckiaceae bacterium]